MPQWAETTIFVILFLLFLLVSMFWVWGTIHPSSFNNFGRKEGQKDFSRKQAFFSFGAISAVLFVLAGAAAAWAGNPTIDLNGFKDDHAVTDAAQYEINGSLLDRGVKLTINSKPVAIDGSGNFKATETLNQGDNTFALLAVNAEGDRKTEENVTIHRTTAAEFATRKAKAAVLAAKTEKTPTPSSSPSTKPSASPSPSPSKSPAPKAAVKVAAATPRPVYYKPTPRPPAPAAPAPAAPTSCTPLTNGGNCYEPGEYCRNSDHGASGIAGDGERIACEDNNGWRWEPN